MAVLIAILLIAVFAGFIGSMLGVGGGIVMVPVLTLAFDVPVKTAIATSIVCVIATSSMAQTAFVARGFADQQIRDLRGRNSGIFVVQIRLFREVLPVGEQSGLLRFFQDGEPVVDEGLNLFSKLRDHGHVLLHLLFTNDFQNLADRVCGDRRHEDRQDNGEEPVGAAADDVPAPLHETPSGHERPERRGGECRSDPPADDQRRNSAHARNLIECLSCQEGGQFLSFLEQSGPVPEFVHII